MIAADAGWKASDRFKIGIVVLVTALTIVLELLVHFLFGIDIVYTHFFYPLLILVAYWYHRRAVYLGLFLAAVHISVEYLQAGTFDPGVVVRAVMFVAVAYILGYLFELLERRNIDLRSYLAGYADRPGTSGRHFTPEEEAAGQVVRPRDTQRLLAGLGSKDPDVRYRAAEALGDLGDARSVEPIAALLADEESGVRWKAAEALGKLGSQAVEPLIRSLHDQSVDVRWMAAIALGEIGDPRAIGPLVETLTDTDTYVRSRAALALGKIGEPTRDTLIDALRSGEEDVRWGAALALGEIGGEKAMQALIGALDDPSPHVRHRAAGALEEIGDAAVPHLIEAFATSGPPICKTIAETLGYIGKPAVGPLLAALHDERWEVRAGAARALGEVADAGAVDALIEALGDEQPEVTAAARAALKDIKKT